MTICVFGHKNPDSDSVVSAIAVAHLYTELGEKAIPYRQGELSPETIFILEACGLEVPELLGSVRDKRCILVDFSDIAQAPDSILEGMIIAIVDHHKLGDLTTNAPLEMWVRPLGCTASIVLSMFHFHKKTVPPAIAKAMMCAILSDTVLFKSVTTTPYDIQAVEELASIAGVKEPLALGMEMFIAKSTIANATAKELLYRDYKDFSMGDKVIGVGQLEVVDISLLEDSEDELLDAMRAVQQVDGKHSVLLLLTDIMKEGSKLLVISEDPQSIEKAFSITLQDNSTWIDGMMSRKKQVIPFLQRIFG